MSDIVTLTHRNVCKNGFTVTDAADSGTPSSTSSPPPSQTVHKRFVPSLLGPACSLGSSRTCKNCPQGSSAFAHLSDDTTPFIGLFLERPFDAYMLLQPLYRTSLAYRKRPQRNRLHRHVSILSIWHKDPTILIAKKLLHIRHHYVRNAPETTRGQPSASPRPDRHHHGEAQAV